MSDYAAAHPLYRAAGWDSPLPLPAGAKWPPPEGYTGWHGLDPSGADCHAWTEEGAYAGTAQLALRMPADIIGIDVDHYGIKRGADTIAEAERRWGPLPLAPYTSARGEGPSGIRLFGVPAGTHLRTVLRFAELGLGHVEIVQRHHRYAVAWPSVHPDTGQGYLWYGTSGPDKPPRTAAIIAKAQLPARWLEELRGADEPGVAAAPPEQVQAFARQHLAATRPSALQGVLKIWEDYTAAGMARHDAMTSVACMAAREAVRGYYPAAQAVAALREAFTQEMAHAKAGQRLVAPGAARAEFAGIWAWAVSQALAESDASRAERAQRAERPSTVFSGGGGLGGPDGVGQPSHEKADAADQGSGPAAETPPLERYETWQQVDATVTYGHGVPRPTLDPSDMDDAATSDDEVRAVFLSEESETLTHSDAAPSTPTHSDTQSDTPTSAAVEDDLRESSSWRPIDLAADWDLDSEPEQPALLRRGDGAFLLYPGRTHSVYGESESGKSWIALIATVEALAAQQDVLYIDHESDPGPIKSRLKLLGVTAEMAKRLTYIRPDGPRDSAWLDLLDQTYALAIIDGVTVAISTDGGNSDSQDETARWLEQVPRMLEVRTGAAVLTIDHVTKSRDARGRFAVGSQQKLNAVSGAAYTARVHVPFGRGQRGELVLRLTKDRPGGIRPLCGPPGEHGTQEAARVVLDSREAARVAYQVLTWSPEGDEATDLPFGSPRELVSDWSTSAAPLPAKVVDYKGAGREAVLPMARYMRHVADNDIGVSRSDAKAAVAAMEGPDGKAMFGRATLDRAWLALVKLEQIETLTTDPNGRSKWIGG